VLEEVAAAGGVVTSAQRLGLDASSAQDVFELARSGDVRALQVAREQAAHLALGVVAVSAVVDPGLVVISGGLGSGAADVLLPLLDDAVRRLGPLRPTLTVSELGDHAVLDGAVVAAVEVAREQVLGRATGHHTTSPPASLVGREQLVPSLPSPAPSHLEAL
jgi:predicted NBD/HSP70 family sugar kinase